MGRSRRPLTAGFLSLALPGAGQVYAGARRRGAALLALSGAVAAVGIVLALLQPVDPLDAAVRREALAALLAADALLLGLRLYAVVHAWHIAAAGARAGATVLAGLVVLVALTALPHGITAYYALRGYETLTAVFADERPDDVLASSGVFVDTGPSPPGPLVADPPRRGAPRPQSPKPTPFRGKPVPLAPYAPAARLVAGRASPYATIERPWVTLLLVGSDHGPERAGHRTDTMIVVALERGTRRAVLLGVPRNFVDVPFVGEAKRAIGRFRPPLNALYQFGLQRPELFPGGEDPGATALKQTISWLLGIRIDYHAFVDLDGFVDMVDALGGVTIHVRERLVDEVTRPSWGETKPRIDVHPGRAYHFSGRTALAYVRSRKASSDYARMTRQRCFLSALASQLDVKSVLLHFGALTRVARESVRTDIPLRSVPDLVRLVVAVDPKLTVTETLDRAYIRNRRPGDGYPRPAVARIRGAVRDALLLPADGLVDRTPLATAAMTC